LKKKRRRKRKEEEVNQYLIQCYEEDVCDVRMAQ